MLLAAAAVANRGEIPVPKLVKEIRDVRGTARERAEPEVWRRAISSETASAVKALMVSVVAGGTGRGAQIPGVPVAGKTGTAETGREGEAPHVWFVAFAPADNPRIAVVVLVENGGDLRDEATGGRVAAPIAKRVIEAHRGVAKW
jgi:peptidoglycan glycosyltransferase